VRLLRIRDIDGDLLAQADWPDYPGIGAQERAAAQPQKPAKAMLVVNGLVYLLMVIHRPARLWLPRHPSPL
jgi:hypothetical protein